MSSVLNVARIAVLALFLLAVFAATASWLVRTRRVSPFRALGRFLRTVSDPIIAPVEGYVVRRGGHPAQANFWLVMGAAIGGIVLLTLIDWTASTAAGARAAFGGGVRGILIFTIGIVYRVLILALIVRVVASWFGTGREARWVRPAYALTDWVVEPLRRVVPPLGQFDISPLAAWLALFLLHRFVLLVLLA